MANSVDVDGYLHIEGFDNFEREAFDKSKIRAGMRKAGRLVTQRAQMNLALARGRDGYPINRTGTTLASITLRVSRPGFLVKVAPRKTGAMKEYYPAYLHYGVKRGARLQRLKPGQKNDSRRERERRKLRAGRQGSEWLISPRDNYISDALQDSGPQVRNILAAAFAQALK